MVRESWDRNLRQGRGAAVRSVAALAGLFTVAASVGADVVFEDYKIEPSGTASSQLFGHSLSLDGDMLLVGAGSDSEFGNQKGSAYVYRFDGSSWVEEFRFSDSTRPDSAYFGWSVGLDGGTALIGCYWDDVNGQRSGSAYIYRENAPGDWQLEQKLIPADGGSFHNFSWRVDIEGDRAVIGSPFWRDFNVGTGRAYVYRRTGSTWVQEALLAPGDDDGSRFGWAVDIDGDRIAVCKLNDDDPFGPGVIYIYTFANGVWTQTDRITNPAAPADNDGFGSFLELKGNLLISSTLPGDRDGRAFVWRFDGTTWNFEDELLPEIPDFGFGRGVSIEGDTAVVAQSLFSSGLAYVFKREQGVWNRTDTLLPANGRRVDFGYDMSLQNGRLALGDYSDGLPLRRGAAYIYDLTPPPPPPVVLTVDGVCPGPMSGRVTGATPGGDVAIVYGLGSASVIPPSFTCGGTRLEVGGPRQGYLSAIADANGVATNGRNAPRLVCGRLRVQAIDLSTCRVSNVVEIN